MKVKLYIYSVKRDKVELSGTLLVADGRVRFISPESTEYLSDEEFVSRFGDGSRWKTNYILEPEKYLEAFYINMQGSYYSSEKVED